MFLSTRFERIYLYCVSLMLLAGCSGMSLPGLPGTAAGQPGPSSLAKQDDASAKPVGQSTTAGSSEAEASLQDKYCDSLTESYAVATSVAKAVQAAAPAAGMQMLTGGGIDIEKTMRDVSKKYVWLPMPVEQAIGKQLFDQVQRDNKVLERNANYKTQFYDKADAAFAAAKREYKVPFDLQLFIVERKEPRINAEALPAGYVLLDRAAASQLDDDALRLILGHEIAHVAKRHNSKQVQQRLIDMGVARQMFERLMKGAKPDELVNMFKDGSIIKKFGGNFAEYQRDQELQADACAIREMVYSKLDPGKARKEYLDTRGTVTQKGAQASQGDGANALGINFSTHPDDATRDAFFAEATQHHQGRLAAK
jgi:Zn-dependent protease with chaperone function